VILRNTKNRRLGEQRHKRLLRKLDSQLINKAKNKFKKQFRGPSQYFHTKSIELARNPRKFLSLEHIESIYAVITAWGMHRMGPNETKVPDFNVFRKSILDNKEILKKLRTRRMEDDDFKDLKKVLRSIKGSESSAQLVANSKVLAHILPDLVAPIDRAYTLRFYGYSYPSSLKEQVKLFVHLSKKMAEIVRKIKEKSKTKSNLPKVVDNLIILKAPKKAKKKK